MSETLADRLWGAFEDYFKRDVKYAPFLNDGTYTPIERLMGAALWIENMRGQHGFTIAPDKNQPVEKCLDWFRRRRLLGVNAPALIFPQVVVGDYRVDFLVLYERGKGVGRLVVECDGHDYHERTKEQARHDKSRDRYLQSTGCQVLRFTGAEIWEDAGMCASDVFQHVYGEMHRADEEAGNDDQPTTDSDRAQTKSTTEGDLRDPGGAADGAGSAGVH